jgi:hypothetical protein
MSSTMSSTGDRTVNAQSDALLIFIFLSIVEFFDQFLNKFAQIFNFLVFDVMLQSISSPRREAASPPSPLMLHSISAVTIGVLQLHFVPYS